MPFCCLLVNTNLHCILLPKCNVTIEIVAYLWKNLNQSFCKDKDWLVYPVIYNYLCLDQGVKNGSLIALISYYVLSGLELASSTNNIITSLISSGLSS